MKKLFLLSVLSLPLLAKDYIVLFKQTEVAVGSLGHGEFQNLLKTSNEKSVTQLKNWIGQRTGKRSANVRDFWLIRGAVTDLNEANAQKLAREPWVHSVYPDRIRQLVRPSPNLVVANSVSELGDDLWGLKRIGMEKIRKEFPQLNGAGIRVGVLDTGLQSRHPEIDRAMDTFKDFVSGMALPYDDHGHGTHVAGTIAGNQVGIAPKARLTIGKIFAAAGSGSDSAILSGMQWIFDPDGDPSTNDFPQIVSNSWGGDLPDGVINPGELYPFEVAIQAWIHGGMIPVFAAGNSGSSPNGFPGGFPEPIAVGAISPSESVAEFSSRGPNLWKFGEVVLTVLKPDISAPGERITSAFPGNKYATWAGTSMATPHVTGAIALLLQANPKLRFSDVKTLLLKSSEKKVDVNYGYGVLNAYELIKAGVALKQ